MTLIELNSGQTGMIRHLHGGRGLVGRLAALGFTLGAPVTMVRNYGRGPIIVAVRGTQVALGRGEANHVLVTLLENEHGSLPGA